MPDTRVDQAWILDLLDIMMEKTAQFFTMSAGLERACMSSMTSAC